MEACFYTVTVNSRENVGVGQAGSCLESLLAPLLREVHRNVYI